jgi:hypothetical protein
MGNNDVVSIRVEALGVSITIADGSIAIEQMKTTAVSAAPESVAAASRQAMPESSEIPVQASLAPAPENARQIPAQPIQAVAEHPAPPPEANGNTVRAASETPVIDEPDQTPGGPPSQNGAVPGDHQMLWSDEEVKKLKALYPTHSASAIAKELGRGRHSVKSKAQNLGLRKDAPPTVTSRPARPAPRSLSAAVTTDPTPAGTALPEFPGVLTGSPGGTDFAPSGIPLCGASNGFGAVRAFNHRPQGLGARFRLKAWP